MARFMEPGFFTFLIDAEPLMAGRQRSAIQRGVRTSTIMLDDLDFTAVRVSLWVWLCVCVRVCVG